MVDSTAQYVLRTSSDEGRCIATETSELFVKTLGQCVPSDPNIKRRQARWRFINICSTIGLAIADVYNQSTIFTKAQSAKVNMST